MTNDDDSADGADRAASAHATDRDRSVAAPEPPPPESPPSVSGDARGPRGPLRTHLTVAVALVAAAALFWPALGWVGATWAVNPYYSHGPLVAVAAIVLAVRGARRVGPADPSAVGLAVVLGAVGVHALAARDAVWWVSAFAFVSVLAGGCLILGGRSWLRAMALPLALLALAVPLPFVAYIAPRLAAVVAGHAATLATLVGVDVIHRGPQLIVGDGSYQVGAPCSGLRSSVALLTLAVGLAGVLRGPIARRAALVALAVPLALAANTLRLSGLLVFADAFGTASGLAYYHGPSSLFLFAAAAVGLFGLGRAMGCDVVQPN